MWLRITLMSCSPRSLSGPCSDPRSTANGAPSVEVGKPDVDETAPSGSPERNHQQPMMRLRPPVSTRAIGAQPSRQEPNPDRFSDRFACLSDRFSFRDFVGFFALSFLGDLSPTAHSFGSARRVCDQATCDSCWCAYLASLPLLGGSPVPLGSVLASPGFSASPRPHRRRTIARVRGHFFPKGAPPLQHRALNEHDAERQLQPRARSQLCRASHRRVVTGSSRTRPLRTRDIL
jgi:hypothetical protein